MSSRSRAKPLHTQVHDAIEKGNVKLLQKLVAKNEIDITSEPYISMINTNTVARSGNLAMMQELIDLGVHLNINQIVYQLSFFLRLISGLGSNIPDETVDKIFNYLKAFLFLIAKQGMPIISNNNNNEYNEEFKIIKKYITKPTNRSELIRALADINDYIPLASSEADPIFDYLQSVGIENKQALILHAIQNKPNAFALRRPLLFAKQRFFRGYYTNNAKGARARNKTRRNKQN